MSLGMIIWVRVPGTCWVPDLTEADMGMIFYPWVTSVPDLNQDGYGADVFFHSRVT
jgi:hypothetical protein